MTTKVKIQAHCSDDKEVRIDIFDGDYLIEKVIQDGEEHECYAYDDRVIRINEVIK